jgi:hypothetical protein
MESSQEKGKESARECMNEAEKIRFLWCNKHTNTAYAINVYPDTSMRALKEIIAEDMGVKGADDITCVYGGELADPGKKVGDYIPVFPWDMPKVSLKQTGPVGKKNMYFEWEDWAKNKIYALLMDSATSMDEVKALIAERLCVDTAAVILFYGCEKPKTGEVLGSYLKGEQGGVIKVLLDKSGKH